MRCIVCGQPAQWITLDASDCEVGVCERDKKYVGRNHKPIETEV